MNYERELEFAISAAQAAGENARRLQVSATAHPEAKIDDSPVTLADRDNERLLTGLITEHWPADGILGEEGAAKSGDSGRRWIIDPIDGTRDFVRGNRFWSVLVALEAGGEPVLGVAHFPMLAETYSAVRGQGALMNGQPIAASKISDLNRAVLSPNGMHSPLMRPFVSTLMDFQSRFWSIRPPGGSYSAAMLAAGQIDVWCQGKAEPWDLAALRVIVEEAGAAYFALDGSRSISAGSAIACARGLEREVRNFFGVA